MLPFEWADEDKEVSEKLNLESPKDLEKFKGEYFVSEMFYSLPIENLKLIVNDFYKQIVYKNKKGKKGKNEKINVFLFVILNLK